MAKRGTTKFVNGEVIRRLIDESPWGARAVASRSGVGIKTVYKMMDGTEPVEVENIAKVAGVFGKGGEDLFQGAQHNARQTHISIYVDASRRNVQCEV
jgi:hypothetical protein